MSTIGREGLAALQTYRRLRDAFEANVTAESRTWPLEKATDIANGQPMDAVTFRDYAEACEALDRINQLDLVGRFDVHISYTTVDQWAATMAAAVARIATLNREQLASV